jgi:hypothetical protein
MITAIYLFHLQAQTSMALAGRTLPPIRYQVPADKSAGINAVTVAPSTNLVWQIPFSSNVKFCF